MAYLSSIRERSDMLIKSYVSKEEFHDSTLLVGGDVIIVISANSKQVVIQTGLSPDRIEEIRGHLRSK